MVTVNRPHHTQAAAPIKVADGPALVEDFLFDADGTRYRVVIVSVAEDQRFVLAEPAGEFGQAGPRRYFPLAEVYDNGPIAQDYVGEKLGFRDFHSVDCYNLTLLIGYALQRPVLVIGPDGFYERREPA